MRTLEGGGGQGGKAKETDVLDQLLHAVLYKLIETLQLLRNQTLVLKEARNHRPQVLLKQIPVVVLVVEVVRAGVLAVVVGERVVPC